MGKRREVRVKAVGKPTGGLFKGELMPNEWLSSVDEIAEKWAQGPAQIEAIALQRVPKAPACMQALRCCACILTIVCGNIVLNH